MDFIFLANLWAVGTTNPTGKHQLALALADQGHRILWLEVAGMRCPRLGQKTDRDRIRTKIKNVLRGFRTAQPGIWYATPLIIPLPTSKLIRAINGVIYAATALLGTWRFGLRNPVLINFLPVAPLAERLWPWKAVYYCVDRWEAFQMYDRETMHRCDVDCCRYADLVLTTSSDLQTRCAPKNPRTALIGHGVNHSHFAAPLTTPVPRPAELPDGPVIGFFGLLSEWVDQPLLVHLAKSLLARHPNTNIVLIGPADIALDALRNEPNIHILGGKLFNELPAYTAYFDVAIIPFVVNELTIAVNPIKLREMLAAGCPVVATDLPEVAAFTDVTKHAVAAKSQEDFVESVCVYLQNPPTPGQREAISNTVRNESWEAKAQMIVDIILRS